MPTLTDSYLRAMPRDDLVKLFVALATERYGTNAFQDRLADKFGVSTTTVCRWQSCTVPWEVVMLLYLWNRSDQYDRRTRHSSVSRADLTQPADLDLRH